MASDRQGEASVNWWQNLLIAIVSGLFGGGLLYLAARSKTKGDVKVALAKVDADHEVEGRSVAIKEMEASLLRLSEENRQLRTDQAALLGRVDALEKSTDQLRESEKQCHKDLAFLQGKIAVLEGLTPSVNQTTVNAAPAATTEG